IKLSTKLYDNWKRKNKQTRRQQNSSYKGQENKIYTPKTKHQGRRQRNPSTNMESTKLN
ncbi:5048_t:CDS:1, partial [Gigaspora rosea]